jgi:hypothetical protein
MVATEPFAPLIGFSLKPRYVSNFLSRIKRLESASNPHHSKMSFLTTVISKTRRGVFISCRCPNLNPYSFSKLPTTGRVTKTNILQMISTYLTEASIQAWIELHLQMVKAKHLDFRFCEDPARFIVHEQHSPQAPSTQNCLIRSLRSSAGCSQSRTTKFDVGWPKGDGWRDLVRV